MWWETIAKKLEWADCETMGSKPDFKKTSAFSPMEVEDTKLGKNFLDQT